MKSMTLTNFELENLEMNEANMNKFLEFLEREDCLLTSLTLNASGLDEKSIVKLTNALQKKN
jgi:succinate dehydrogenase flavin-adding protein (antitoxin of CptAB toxin-antitoxin module)